MMAASNVEVDMDGEASLGSYDPAMDELRGADANTITVGTVLEAAFVDPAYEWPPADGQGKNAIELKASEKMLGEEPTEHSQKTSPTVVQVSSSSKTKPKKSRFSFFRCKRANKHVVTANPSEEDESNHADMIARQEKKDAKDKAGRYSRVPDGMLIYRLDTATHEITLLSSPSAKTDKKTLLKRMVVAKASPSHDKSRRGMELVGTNGGQYTLVACEQRTAISWLEAIDMMLSNKERVDAANKARGGKKLKTKQESRVWGDENLNQKQRDEIEEQYLTLADYSNKLIRSGAIPGRKKGGGGSSGIYYAVETRADTVQGEEEALESIAKRRAVIKDSWDFYRMICSLLRDRRKYDEVFRRMQHDPVFPYLNSMTGLNDPGDRGYENADKPVMQRELDEFDAMSKTELAKTLIAQAEEALPSLVEICKALAGSLGMEEVGVGPIKEVQSALRKAEKKYEGDLLKVTDYCRALVVVKDFPSLLALLELARDSFGPLIRRVKLSTLKSDQQAIAGGYRDCKINIELKGHICEIQVHLWPMWVVCGVDGFRHYRHCLEYSTDSFGDPYEALEGLDRKTMAELIVMAEEAVAERPLSQLEWYDEKFILDYFAEVGLFMKHGLDAWAEVTLKYLVKLRTDSPDIGPDHTETLILNKYLEKCLRAQGKNDEAAEVKERIDFIEKKQRDEKQEAELSMWDSLVNFDALDMIMDPNKKEREEEEKLKKDVKASKKQWRRIRRERFAFLDSNQSTPQPSGTESDAASELT